VGYRVFIVDCIQAAVPRARGVASNQDIEVFERERGNEEFKKGNFTEAVKCYTKCLGLKVCILSLRECCVLNPFVYSNTTTLHFQIEPWRILNSMIMSEQRYVLFAASYN
jgi:hypothetical protein